ncbi:MAG TPA: choice-of-anchor D domain-containing protein [Myxococcota bacterium]|nr:choice-of-anchor D domain-containing protein [Myxococcota bacterium]HQK51318.1 choice-of-anchor D domain-containing protein [Myxococcota bacterium]
MIVGSRSFGMLCLALLACSGGGNPNLGGLDVGPLPDRGSPDQVEPDPGPPPQDVPTPDSGDLPVTGRLVLDPEAIVFGGVAEGVTVTRPLRISNGGTDQLRLHSVTLVENPGQEFALQTSLPAEIALMPTQTLEIGVNATNLLGGTGTFQGRIRVVSDDPVRPEAFVTLEATRTGKPSCAFQVTGWTGEDLLDLGDVPAGGEREVFLQVANTGNAPISFQRVDLLACAGDPIRCGSQLGDPEWIQGAFADDPSPTLNPEQTARIRLVLRGNTATAGTLRTARLQILWSCAQDPTLQVWPNECPTEGDCPPNLSARFVAAALTATPAEVRFDPVLVGCTATRTVRLDVTGESPLGISAIHVDPSCNQEGTFKVDAPEMPTTLQPGGSLEFSVTFEPASEALFRCHLDVLDETGGGRWVQVPLSGSGVAPEPQVDSFTQGTQDPDILLVVDTSGSMTDDIDTLKKAFTAWMQAYATDGRKVRLGLIGLSVDPGCPQVGVLQGPPRLLTAGDGNAFATLLDQMTNDLTCSPSAGEAGLEAARRALSSPLIDDEGIPCSSDQPCTPPARCVDGVCGGPNRGFLRPLSPLDVVIFSDEDDQSPDTVDFYVQFLRGLKGFGNESRSRFDVIVGDLPDGCDRSGATAAPAPRYIEAAQSSGGAFQSFCTGALAQSLQQFAQAPFPQATRFRLSRAPRPGTVSVLLDGQPCAEDWTLGSNPWQVEFVATGACMPAPGTSFQVRYLPACR